MKKNGRILFLKISIMKKNKKRDQHGTYWFFQKYKPFLALATVGAAFLLQSLLDERRFGSGAKRYSKNLFGDSRLQYGPAVNKLVVELENPVSTVETADVKVQTLSRIGEVTDTYLSDEKKWNGCKKSKYVTLELATSYNKETFSGLASPFTYNMEVFMNQWVKRISWLSLIWRSAANCPRKKMPLPTIIPEAAQFTVHKEFTGTYLNALKKARRKLTLNYPPLNQKPSKMARKILSSFGSMARVKGNGHQYYPFLEMKWQPWLETRFKANSQQVRKWGLCSGSANTNLLDGWGEMGPMVSVQECPATRKFSWMPSRTM